jgi:lipopolysaccharide transport system permease protein
LIVRGSQPLLLLVRFTEREILSRFAGSAFGLIWALANPLLLLAIYSFVFGHLFKQRLGDLSSDSYIVFLALALWPWMMFADGVMRAMQSVQSNAPLVKKVAFPHLLLVLAAVNSVFLVHLAGYTVVLIILAATGTTLHAAGLLNALLAIATLYLIAVGVGAFLAALQTLLRDVEQVVAPALTMLQFLSPVLYPVSAIPDAYRHWFAWNPLTPVLQRLRDGFLLGATPQFGDLSMLFVGALIAAAGIAFFVRLSPYFEDFL